MKRPRPVSTEVVKPVSTEVVKLTSHQTGSVFCHRMYRDVLRARSWERTIPTSFGEERIRSWERRLPACIAGTIPDGTKRVAQFLVVVAAGFIFTPAADAQSILPPAQGSIGGGNPLQGLGRPDDPSPSRYKDFAKTNLQDTSSSGSGSGLSSDLLKSLDGADGATTESLNKLLSPDGLKSLTGGGTEGDGSGADANSGGGLQSNSPEFTDKAGASFSEQLQGSNVGDLPSGETESSDQSSLRDSSKSPARGGFNGGGSSVDPSLSTTGSSDGPEGLPPEPAGLAAPLKAPSLSAPLKSTSLSSVPENAESAKTAKNGAEKTPTGSASASTRGAAADRDAANRKASPLSTSVSERIRQALEGRGRTAKTTKSESSARAEHLPPPELKMVPAPPPGPVEPAGPTPERHALALMKVGNYHQAERQLRDLVSTDPSNLHARYLFAVSLVYNKKYDEAKNNYGIIIRKSQDQRLVEMAESGLAKLMH